MIVKGFKPGIRHASPGTTLPDCSRTLLKSVISHMTPGNRRMKKADLCFKYVIFHAPGVEIIYASSLIV